MQVIYNYSLSFFKLWGLGLMGGKNAVTLFNAYVTLNCTHTHTHKQQQQQQQTKPTRLRNRNPPCMAHWREREREREPSSTNTHTQAQDVIILRPGYDVKAMLAACWMVSVSRMERRKDPGGEIISIQWTCALELPSSLCQAFVFTLFI